ncbi:hypothetical protein KDW_43060 [Dictyobacter vulcani]|uniref:ABC3 transporter permease C-terminal domain-containing protein n=1 Tax=Dictyobacter vulcani TaxID=2607529 RepID=A0A5J4KL25_9CHLR|nr:FtsX-like permease family protein [Dictyobacter vulcani]GER90144.1 hypothetical protein KDW_43060 [Dictyobacter vulcani]
MGWVEERWITTGASLRYLHQSRQTQTLLLWSVLVVSLGYLLVTLSSLASSQKRDFAILSAVGWRPWHPSLMFIQQVFVYALVGGFVGIGSALLIVRMIGAFPDWPIVFLTLPGILLLALLCTLAPLWMIWRLQPANLLKGGMTLSRSLPSSRRVWLARHLLFISEDTLFTLRTVLRSWGRTSIALGSLFLSACLLILMIDAILVFQQSLQGTLLGTYLLAQTAVPLLAGVIFAILFTFLNVTDLFLLQMRERWQEIGLLQAIGWRPWLVQRRFIREGLLLACMGTIPGVLFARWILMQQHETQHVLPLSWL